MSTTTIRLSDTLKARVGQAAKRNGTTAHSYILDAIAEKAERDELRCAMYAEAEERYREIADSGRTIAWDEMRQYLEARASGKSPKKPAARKLSR